MFQLPTTWFGWLVDGVLIVFLIGSVFFEFRRWWRDR